MQLPQLKYDFHTLPPDQQEHVFLEYLSKRQRDMSIPPPVFREKKEPGEKKERQKCVTLTTEQMEVLRQLKLL